MLHPQGRPGDARPLDIRRRRRPRRHPQAGWSRPLLLLVLAAAVLAFFVLDLGRFLTLSALQERQADFAAAFAQRPWTVAGAFFALYVAVTALSLPGAALLTLAAGALFGLGWGLVIVSFASSLGATLAFLVSRHLLRDAVKARFGARMAEIDRGVAREGGFYLFTLRLVPVLPFFVINLLMGLTAMKARTFYWVSQLGMLAGTVVYVNAGTQLARLDSLAGILSPGLVASFALLGVFPLVARRALDALQARRVYAPWADRRPRRFDRNLVVIGAGAAGLVTSYIAAAVKARVTLVERHAMGGDCLNTGCVPSKALIRSARLAHDIRQAREFGLQVDEPVVDFPAVMDRIHRVIADIAPHDSVQRYTGLGVEVEQGEARILDPWHVQITRADGSVQRLSTRSIVVATGASPTVPPLPGLDAVGFLTSDTLWTLRELPRRLVVLGGGPIGCELAQAFARLGSEVTQVEMGPRLMPREEEAASACVRSALEASGVKVLTGHRARRCWVEQGELGEVGSASGGPTSSALSPTPRQRMIELEVDSQRVDLAFDALLVAVGRTPRVRGFGLEELGLVDPTAPARVLQTDAGLHTRLPNILAAGDVAGPWQFTHTASHQAWTAAVNALFGRFRRFKVDHRVIPWCTFTDPEVARVGLSQAEAREQGVPFEVTRVELDDHDRAIADGQTQGFVQVLTVPGRDTVLGVTIVGAHAGELIAEWVLAMKAGLGLNRILGAVHVYPTMNEANKAVAGAWKRAHAPQGVLRWVERYHRWARGGDA